MPSRPVAAVIAAHNAPTQSDSTTSVQRYEERISHPPTQLDSQSQMHHQSSPPVTIPLARPPHPRHSPSPPLPKFISEPGNPRRHRHPPPFPGIERFPSQAGAEPGVNPRRDSSAAKYALFKEDCTIEVIDYDAEDAHFQRLDNADFLSMMKSSSDSTTTGSHKQPVTGEPDYHPMAIRWINIGGIDWDVLSTLALRYNIHSLALEDVLHEQGDIQSKADYYPNHLFIRVLSHSVCPLDTIQDHIHHTDQGRRNTLRHRSRRGPAPVAPPAYDTDSDTALAYGDSYNNVAQPDLESGDDRTNTRPSEVDRDGRQSSFSSTAGFNLSREPSDNQNKNSRRFLNLPLLRRLQLRNQFSRPKGWWQSVDQQQRLRLRILTEVDRVNVVHEPMYIFLFYDGTVICITPAPNLDFTTPITERLYHNQSVLRTSEDASLLIEALLDLVVDRVLEVVDEYHMKIYHLEHEIMIKPCMDSVRSRQCLKPIKFFIDGLKTYAVVHVLSADLIMHKLTVEPIKTMIYNLRRYDAERVIAMRNHFKSEAQATSGYSSDSDAGSFKSRRSSDNHNLPADVPARGLDQFGDPEESLNQRSKSYKRKHRRRQTRRSREVEKEERLRWEQAEKYTSTESAKGFLSYTCKVYLADVGDHIEFALTSLDMFAGISENLIDYAFNMASYEMNQVMSRLTLVTIIFLPLTLLTGYFGMNFEPMWSVNVHSEVFFWKIAVPVMAALIPMFMFHDLKNFVKTLTRRWRARKLLKDL